ncbi:MAG: flagellin FliC [Bdellovibrionales bacterium]|nr:flagellin FliC [Bdellovibrionales bacterium]
MSVSIASNIAALEAARKLNSATNKLGKVFERLSSGVRINSASDDPAGLAVADALRADTKIATVAIRNANDGISLTSIADAGLSEIENLLTRMAELAEQSSNGVYTNAQRSALSSEFEALGSEIERIASTTTFNGLNLLSNSSSISVQVGLDGSANSQITIEAVLGTLDSLGLAGSGSSQLSYSIIGTTVGASTDASENALDAVNAAIDSLSATRGKLGASEARLNSAVSNLTLARENFAAAESRIRDIDVAEETAELTRLTILQQGAAAVFAQANLQPEIALALLQT